MREEPPISHETLGTFLLDTYGIAAQSLAFLPVGDTHSAIYRAEATDSSFLLKLRPSFDDAQLLASRFLFDSGLSEVVAPIPTTTTALYAKIESFSAVLFPFVEGDTGWDTMADVHWREVGRIFRRIHSLNFDPAFIQGISREQFDPQPYAQAVAELEARLTPSAASGTALDLLQTTWHKNQATIHALTNAMLTLAESLKRQSLAMVICHADLHPGNLLRDPAGPVYVIDWDDVMLAPKERDFIFTGEPNDDDTGSPFFDGYRPTDINWTAVTYYRYERVVTDFIEYARDIFRDTLNENTKLDSAARFVECLRGGNFIAAEVAAEHLPPGLATCAVHRTP
ncbi:MAG: aminoglycoside phosphotransferase family protein [Chloroflexota bacterium]